MKESDVQEQIASAMQEEIQANYDRIRQIVEDEITRIKNDPNGSLTYHKHNMIYYKQLIISYKNNN